MSTTNSSTQSNQQTRKSTLSIRDMIVFALLGTLMFCSKLIMEALPNIHLLGMLTMVYTIVYRQKALIPIYICVFLTGLYGGFSMWWIPYLYLWTVLWGITMLLPKKISHKIACVVYPIICGLHGLAYGTLYAPAQALMFGLNFEQMIAWIIAGLPWDAVHGFGNLFVGILVLPLSELLKRLNTMTQS